MRRTLWLAAALILLTIGARTAVRAEQPLTAATITTYLPLVINAPPGGQTPAQAAMAAQVLALVNSQRATAGCPALAMNVKLITAAQGQSRDMAELGFFSHINPDPSRATVGMRATMAGYSWSYIGENIAAGYGTPAAVMDAWMGSQGHRDNILNCAYTDIGVGYYAKVGSTYGDYWTQVFGRP